MSLFSWMRRSNGTGAQPKDKATPLKTTGAAASHTLIGELLCHLEEHGHMATEQEQEQRPLQSGRGLYWFEKYPKLRNLISISELQQLELLCSQIPHSHAATVLSRFREVAATSNTKPWEAASILKQVMRDFPGHGGFVDKESRLSMQTAWQQPIEDCRILHRMKQGAVTSAIHKCGEHSREEIPTISGYVDWAMRNPGSFTRASRDWGHPYDYSGSMRHTEPYSTTL